MPKILRAGSIDTTRAAAKATIYKLIDVHHQTMKDIRDGKKFWRDGVDVSDEIYKRCEHEIIACGQVLTAIDHMKAGDIKRAADLCSEIQAHLPPVN